MLIIPAIDLKDGKCVRLRQGRMDDETVFSDDPVAMAGRWVEAGATHVSVNTMDAGYSTPGEHIAAIEAFKLAFA